MTLETRFALLVAICVGFTGIAYAASVPYSTTVVNGDMGSARLVYGDSAQVGILDALPAFTDIDAYELYYRFDDNNDCDDTCLRAPYRALKDQGRVRMLTVGTPVRVVGHMHDPQEPQYEVCKITLRHSSRMWLALCTGLGKQP